MNNGRPESLPRCEHDRFPPDCGECRTIDRAIKESLEPLAKSFWVDLPKNNANLEHMLFQAYRMGMRHEN